MRNLSWILIPLNLLNFIHAISLYDAYLEAGPQDGYDKYLVLERDSLYTGNVGIADAVVRIAGNGATIDLQDGAPIWVFADETADAHLDLDHCSIINGAYYGMTISGESSGVVTNCNFVGHTVAIQQGDSSSFIIRNCNFVQNEAYGFSLISYYEEWGNVQYPYVEISYCNAWQNGMDYAVNIPLPD